ncbi:MAG: WYL domain-containing protein [Clostridiales bacterium]|nr:WYL domain-containing protein [Clostridiales bacterium]
MKYELMLRILFELLSKKTVQASYLAEKYEISTRTVYRYISCIEYAGIPIYTKRGNAGGFCIMENYRLPASFLTKKEFNETISALKGINEHVENKTITSVINKLFSLTKKEYYDFDIKNGHLIIDSTSWGDTSEHKDKLTMIENGIENNLILEIDYLDRNGERSKRLIEPHNIVLKQGLWYVFAYCNLRNEFRLFKIGRIEKINTLKDTFVKRPIPDVLPFENWYATDNAELVEFIVDEKIVADVEEWLGVNNVKKGEKITAKAVLPIDDILIGKILSFGDGLKVVSPKKLKKDIKKKIEDIIKYYN